jgi:putative ABC transport system ATP-binding protein
MSKAQSPATSSNSIARSSNDFIVELDDVHLKLDSGAGPVNILRGVNLQVAAGERVGVVGPSGPAKATRRMFMPGMKRPAAATYRSPGQ